MAVNDPTGEPIPESGGAEAGRSEMFPRSYVEQLRSEAARNRTENKMLKDQLGKLSTADSTIKGLKVDVALTDLSHEQGFDKRYTKFLLVEEGKLSDLDPDADDFRDTLKNRIDDLNARHPQPRRTTATRSGSPFQTPGPGAPASTQITSRDAIRGMRPEEVEAHLKAGNLNQILGRS